MKPGQKHAGPEKWLTRKRTTSEKQQIYRHYTNADKSLHLNKGQYICSAPSTGRHQNYRENKTLIKIINIIYSSLLG